MIALLPLALDRDASPTNLERVRRNTHEAIAEMQRVPAMRARTIRGVVLEDGVATPIAHGLGVPAFVTHTPPRGPVTAGWIEEIRDGSYDLGRFVVLKASGYGATVTVDVEVRPL